MTRKQREPIDAGERGVVTRAKGDTADQSQRAAPSKPVGRLTRAVRRGEFAKPKPARKKAGAMRAKDREIVDTVNRDLRVALGPQVIEHIPIKLLRVNPRNARRHSTQQIRQLISSVAGFGFIGVLVVDEEGMVLAGHGRLEAARACGMTAVPCVRIEHLTGDQKRAFALADNRLAELSCWDDEVLGLELGELSAPDLDLGFDFEITGFDSVDVDRLTGTGGGGGLAKGQEFSEDPDDVVPELMAEALAVSKPGDLWQLGPHRLLCGDALEPECYARLLGTESVAQVFADPPYNVPITRNVTSVAGFREFVMASGEMSEPDFIAFLTRALMLMREVVGDGAILHVCMDWRHASSLWAASAGARLALKNICVWVKPNAGMGSFYRSQHEFIFVLKAGTAKHVNNFGLGARGRHRSNVWRYPSVVGQRQGVNAPDGGHPTVKPVALVSDAIRDCSKRGGIILDPFGGSGTTLIAAERVGRCARLIEIDPHYNDLIIRRWQAATGGARRSLGDGSSFDEIAARRARGGRQGR